MSSSSTSVSPFIEPPMPQHSDDPVGASQSASHALDVARAVSAPQDETPSAPAPGTAPDGATVPPAVRAQARHPSSYECPMTWKDWRECLGIGVLCFVPLAVFCTLAVAFSQTAPEFDWQGNKEALTVLVQSEHPCIPLTQHELDNNVLYAGSFVSASASRHSHSLALHDKLQQMCDILYKKEAVVALPMLVFGWEFNRCVLAIKTESGCLTLANPKTVSGQNMVTVMLQDTLLGFTHSLRSLPLQSTVSAICLSCNDNVRTTIALTDAASVTVAHWLASYAIGKYAGDSASVIKGGPKEARATSANEAANAIKKPACMANECGL